MKYLIFIIVFLFFGSVNAQNLSDTPKKVLFVMSAAHQLPLHNGKIYDETGVFLSEFYLPYKAVVEAGYQVDFATPEGKKPWIDKESLKKKYWKKQENELNKAIDFVNQNADFQAPIPLHQLSEYQLDTYSALVIPGGQGLMVDLINDKKIPEILTHFHAKNKPIGLICHAPALLLAFEKNANPFAGYHINSVTGLEEIFIEKVVMKGKPNLRKIGKKLSEHGMIYRKGRPAANFAIRDKMLITSQNPYSNEKFIELFLESLKEEKQP